MSFNPALNASTPSNTGFAAIANLALGLLARNPGQPRTENMEPERSSLLQQYPEIGPDIAGLLSINARSNTTISSDHGPSVDADKGAGEIKRSGRAKRASKELQARIDTAMRFTLAGFRKQFGQIEPNLVLAPGSFEKRMFETGEVYGGHSAGWLNKDEYEIMKTPGSPLQNALEQWVIVHAYAQATGGDLLTWEPQKILSWVRKELAQVRAQADDDQRETRIREAFDAGKNSQIARSRTHGIVSPIYAYPNMEDVNKFAPCGIPVLRFQWVDPDVPSYSLIFGPPDPALCRGNAETDIAYKLARQIAHGPRNQLFKPDNAKYLPRNMAVQVSRTEVSQNCGPDNLVIKKIPALSPLIRFDLCPPYVSPYHRWRESMKNSLVTDYEAKRKREFFDPQPQQQFSPPQRPFVGQPGFDNQRKQFDGQAFNQAGRQRQDG